MNQNQVAEGKPADAPLPPWFLQDLEANKAKEAEAEREKKREAARSTNPYMMQEGLPKFESITPEASKEVRYRRGVAECCGFVVAGSGNSCEGFCF